MLVRRRGWRGTPKPKLKPTREPQPERKNADHATPTTVTTISLSSLQDKSQHDRKHLERPREKARGALGSRQHAALRHGQLPNSSPSRARRDSLSGSPTTNPGAISAVELDEDADCITWQPLSGSSSDAHDTLHDLIALKFDEVLSSIDGETFTGREEDLLIREEQEVSLRGGWRSGHNAAVSGADRLLTSAVLSTNYFAKAKLYANSRLPNNLPSLHLYMPAWPLVCLAAQYSRQAYARPTGEEREAFVNADWRMGTKAMVIKSVPIDDMNCVVFAIRGSQTFLDWAVNLNSVPVSPRDFLDDPGNLCHQGFLAVARKMIKPVAARLRSLLEEKPWRRTCSLLMTGHSAGGAVATLLYAHMLAENVTSELNILTGCFRRIHCLTFGTPPISLLPLTKPPGLHHRKSLFMSFINEGDPVPRADKAYVRSLFSLYASPAPGLGTDCLLRRIPVPKPCNQPRARKAAKAPKDLAAPPKWVYKWQVPPGTLSNAGRLIVLRELNSDKPETANDIKADITCDQQLREVVFGDPVMHMMSVYARRVEVLATKAVTAKIWG